jgi:hypothetical protein
MALNSSPQLGGNLGLTNASCILGPRADAVNFNLVGLAVSAEKGEALLEERRDRRRQRELECRFVSRRRHLVPGLGQDTGELVGIGFGREIVEVMRPAL